MLAAFDFVAYSNAIHRLESGDRLLLYTDGIVEASDVQEMPSDRMLCGVS